MSFLNTSLLNVLARELMFENKNTSESETLDYVIVSIERCIFTMTISFKIFLSFLMHTSLNISLVCF